MTIEIPVWLLWTIAIGLGVPVASFVLLCAFIGFMYIAHDMGWFR